MKPRSINNRLFVCLIIVFVLATVVLAVVLAVTVLKLKKDDTLVEVNQALPTSKPEVTQALPTSKPHESNTSAEDVCITERCVMAAARVREAMDLSVNPCDDFYNFACGTWIKKHPIPEDKGSYGTFSKLMDDVSIILKTVLEANSTSDLEAVRKARDYYKSCVNLDGIEKLGLNFIYNFTKHLGGWPVLDLTDQMAWQEKDYNLETLLKIVRAGSNSLPLIKIGVGQDDKNPTEHILFIDQPALDMPSRDYFLKARNDTTLMAYQTMWKDIAIAFGANASIATSDAEKVVDLQIQIANITVPKENRREPEKLYNKMTVNELEKNFTGIEWSSLIKDIFTIVSINISDSEPVIVAAPEYLRKLGDVLKKSEKRTIVNYIVGMKVMEKTFYLPKKFTDIKMKYLQVLSGAVRNPPRWQSCSSNVKYAMPEVVGRLFVNSSFQEDAKTDVENLVDGLKGAFKRMIDKLPWMASKTKRTAKLKADYIEARVGYPDVVYNDDALNKYYKNIKIIPDDPLRNLIALSEANVISQLKKLRQTYDWDQWDMSPAEINAYYNAETNQITFPAAILQPPFYDHGQPAYLNYGGIGYVIGHEITHGFDDQGRLYDRYGKLHSWWSEEDGKNFKQQVQCIIDQYNNFTVPGTDGMTLNGVNTQGENIADNGGIKESFKAYRSWILLERSGKEEQKLPGLPYTQNQLYFLNAAQVWCDNERDQAKIQSIRTDSHSLDMYRVYGPLQNFDEFAKAWNCPPRSFMNPEKKCSVW